MNTDDPELVEQVFHRALHMNEEERSGYFETFPQTQIWIIEEVVSLLASYDSSPELLDQNAVELGLSLLADDQSDFPEGLEIGSYRIERLIGRGGMGDVYLAADLTLNRQVALKFLSSSFSDDIWAKRQFVREAQAVALLDHRNICVVYGYEEIANHRFIAMQYVDGISLAELIRSGNVDPEKVGQMAVEIAEAIAEAHSHGILHRDIKPGNIMIGRDGQIKVLDFGIAKHIQSDDSKEAPLTSATRPGLILGTVAYMSPEQLKAERLDFRSDIFSLGTVFFEMMAGRHPFEKKSDAETITSILEKDLPAGQLVSAGVPVGLRQVVKKCLEKEKEARYQSVHDIVLDLQQPHRRSSSIHANFGKILLACCLVLILGVTVLLYYRTSASSLVLIPFVNETGDQQFDYLAEGMAEDLSLKISAYGKIKVKNLTETSKLAKGLSDPIKVGQDNSVDLVLTGKVTNQSDGLVLETALLDVATGVKVRGWNFRFDAADLPNLQQKVADQLFAGLSLPLTADEGDRRGAFSKNGEAVRQYFIGRHYWGKRDEENLKKAITAFETSINLDPGFSRGYSGLADSYVLLNLVAYAAVPTKVAMTKARAAARKALEIDPNDVNARTSLAIVLTKYEWNWAAAEKEYQLAIQIDPEYAPAHYGYSGLLAILGRTSESIHEAKRAKDLDPFSPLADLNLARTYYYGRQYDGAIETLNSLTKGEGTDNKLKYMLGLVLLQKKMYAEATSIFEEVSAKNKLFGAAALGFSYAKLGRRSDALKLIEELKSLSTHEFVPHQEFAIIYLALDDRTTAMKYLNLAFEERHAALISVKVEPLFDGLRGDPRFARLIDSMQLI